MTGIGQLREGPLHRALKAWAADAGAAFEVRVDGYVVDVVRGDGELVEVQTGSFSPLRAKLDALLDRHRMRIVHPVPAQRTIVRIDDDGLVLSQRPSPKRPDARAIFEGLVSFPTLLSHPNLTIDVVLCREDHVRAAAPTRGRRLKRDPGQRVLREVLEVVPLRRPADLLALLPPLQDQFTTRDLAGMPLPLAQKAVACLRDLELVTQVGRRGRAPLYAPTLRGQSP